MPIGFFHIWAFECKVKVSSVFHHAPNSRGRICPESQRSIILRAILEGYPLSAGIFRELLQNSDDAGAKKQV
jgi:hypothetical protein